MNERCVVAVCIEILLIINMIDEIWSQIKIIFYLYCCSLCINIKNMKRVFLILIILRVLKYTVETALYGQGLFFLFFCC